jgi:hypothetical protein
VGQARSLRGAPSPALKAQMTMKNESRKHGFVNGADKPLYNVSAEAQNDPFSNLAPHSR